jgi:hypothetical protein
MSNWNEQDLAAIGAARELEIASLRDDGSLRNPVTIWAVRVGDELYVRSVRGADGGWHRGARKSHEGRIETGGVTKDVTLIDVGPDRADEIDAAYREKYGYPSGPVNSITSPEARETTMRLVPR